MEDVKSFLYIAQKEDGTLFVTKMNKDNLKKYNEEEVVEAGYDYFEEWETISSNSQVVKWVKEQLKGE